MREVYLRSLCLYQLCDGKHNIESKFKKEIINTKQRKLQFSLLRDDDSMNPVRCIDDQSLIDDEH